MISFRYTSEDGKHHSFQIIGYDLGSDAITLTGANHTITLTKDGVQTLNADGSARRSLQWAYRVGGGFRPNLMAFNNKPNLMSDYNAMVAKLKAMGISVPTYSVPVGWSG